MAIALYQTRSPAAYYIVEGEDAISKLPIGAELALSPTTTCREEALTEIDRFLGRPPYLEVRAVFQAALRAGHFPSEAVRKVHAEVGEVSGGDWPDHFHEALGSDRSAIASLFVTWWPFGITGMTDQDFDRRVHELS